jgi:hypothetical protein
MQNCAAMRRPTLLAIVADLAPLAMTMRSLGIMSQRSSRDGDVHGEEYGLPNADLIIVAPVSTTSTTAEWLGCHGPSFAAISSSSAPGTAGRPLASSGRYAEFRVSMTPSAGFAVLSRADGGSETSGREAPFLFDHVSCVVPRLDLLAADLGDLGELDKTCIGRRWFPDFSVESAFVLFDGSYLELAAPTTGHGIFGDRLSQSGPGLIFACIRPANGAALKLALSNPWLRFGPPQAVRAALRPGQEAISIGTAHTLSRKSASGLMLTVFDTDWPWVALGPNS